MSLSSEKTSPSSGDSHRAAYGRVEDTARESFYSLFTLDTDCQLSCACLRLIWSHLTLQQQLFYNATITASLLLCASERPSASKVWSDQTTWCTTPPIREAAVLSMNTCQQMRAQKKPYFLEMQPNTWQTICVCVWHLHILHTLLRFSCIAGILFWIYTRKF